MATTSSLRCGQNIQRMNESTPFLLNADHPTERAKAVLPEISIIPDKALANILIAPS
jgi:hypothetical protein